MVFHTAIETLRWLLSCSYLFVILVDQSQMMWELDTDCSFKGLLPSKHRKEGQETGLPDIKAER